MALVAEDIWKIRDKLVTAYARRDADACEQLERELLSLKEKQAGSRPNVDGLPQGHELSNARGRHGNVSRAPCAHASHHPSIRPERLTSAKEAAKTAAAAARAALKAARAAARLVCAIGIDEDGCDDGWEGRQCDTPLRGGKRARAHAGVASQPSYDRAVPGSEDAALPPTGLAGTSDDWPTAAGMCNAEPDPHTPLMNPPAQGRAQHLGGRAQDGTGIRPYQDPAEHPWAQHGAASWDVPGEGVAGPDHGHEQPNGSGMEQPVEACTPGAHPGPVAVQAGAEEAWGDAQSLEHTCPPTAVGAGPSLEEAVPHAEERWDVEAHAGRDEECWDVEGDEEPGEGWDVKGQMEQDEDDCDEAMQQQEQGNAYDGAMVEYGAQGEEQGMCAPVCSAECEEYDADPGCGTLALAAVRPAVGHPRGRVPRYTRVLVEVPLHKLAENVSKVVHGWQLDVHAWIAEQTGNVERGDTYFRYQPEGSSRPQVFRSRAEILRTMMSDVAAGDRPRGCMPIPSTLTHEVLPVEAAGGGSTPGAACEGVLAPPAAPVGSSGLISQREAEEWLASLAGPRLPRVPNTHLGRASRVLSAADVEQLALLGGRSLQKLKDLIYAKLGVELDDGWQAVCLRADRHYKYKHALVNNAKPFTNKVEVLTYFTDALSAGSPPSSVPGLRAAAPEAAEPDGEKHVFVEGDSADPGVPLK